MSDFEHWQLQATVHKDYVEEIHIISNAANGIRRQPQIKKWQLGRVLGQGGSGQVQLQTNNEDSQERAVKRISTSGTKMSNAEYKEELKALLEFSKPKHREAAVFVEFLGWFSNGWDVFLAMEYVPLGDLESNVGKSKKLPESEVKDISQQILFGLSIMHSQAFAHRDLKPQNVLVVHGSPQWWIKLADFGLSKRLTDETGYHTRAGTQSYMAPELLNYLSPDKAGGSDYTNAVDIWALGCIVYRLITAVVPFPPGRDLMKYCEDKSLFPFDYMFDSGVSSTGANFIRQLLVAQPKDRPTAAQALQHQWIGLGKQQKEDLKDVARSNFRGSDAAKLPPVDFQSGNDRNFEYLTIANEGYNTVSHKGLQTNQSIEPPKFMKRIPISESLSDLDHIVVNEGLSVPEPSTVTVISKAQPKIPKSEKISQDPNFDGDFALTGLIEINSQLIWAVKSGDLDSARRLLIKKANPSLRDDDGVPLIHLAAKSGIFEMFHILMDNEADISATDQNMKGTLLHSAAEGGSTDIVEELLRKGVDINARDKLGWTALYLAAERTQLQMMEYLIANGIDVNSKDNEERTVLELSASFGPYRVIMVLLDNGAHDYESKALQMAKDRKRIEVVKMLTQHQAKLNRDLVSETPPDSIALGVKLAKGHSFSDWLLRRNSINKIIRPRPTPIPARKLPARSKDI